MEIDPIIYLKIVEDTLNEHFNITPGELLSFLIRNKKAIKENIDDLKAYGLLYDQYEVVANLYKESNININLEK